MSVFAAEIPAKHNNHVLMVLPTSACSLSSLGLLHAFLLISAALPSCPT